jgi:predicted nucleic-acid-binding protein
MKAVDTNVVLRFLTWDDDVYSPLASACIAGGVFVAHSVLIETEWALRSGYGWDRRRIARNFADFLAIETVDADQVEALRWALDRFSRGADWADMLHLIASSGHSAFATFDRALRKQAGSDSPIPIETVK